MIEEEESEESAPVPERELSIEQFIEDEPDMIYPESQTEDSQVPTEDSNLPTDETAPIASSEIIDVPLEDNAEYKKPRRSILKTPSRVPNPHYRKSAGGSPIPAAHVVVLTPMRANKHQRASLGADQVLTPVRRSLRKSTPFKSMNSNNLNRVLAESNYAYTPNASLNPRGFSIGTPGTKVLFAESSYSPDRSSPRSRV